MTVGAKGQITGRRLLSQFDDGLHIVKRKTRFHILH